MHLSYSLQGFLEQQALFRPGACLLAGAAVLAFLIVSYVSGRRRGEEMSALEKAEMAVELVLTGLWTLFSLAGFLGEVWGFESLQNPGLGSDLYDAGLPAALSILLFFLLLRRGRMTKREEGSLSKWDCTQLAASGLFAVLFCIALGICPTGVLTGSGFWEELLPGLELGLLAAAGLFVWISALARLLYARRKGEAPPVHLYILGIGPVVLLGFVLLMAGFVWLPRLLEPGA
ncbi:MAG: hypothetical protein HFE86_01105 [Clostridiales bacterium]|nr:hypothetical protein [Clostridiales bacterium]